LINILTLLFKLFAYFTPFTQSCEREDYVLLLLPVAYTDFQAIQLVGPPTGLLDFHILSFGNQSRTGYNDGYTAFNAEFKNTSIV
jgi:hypothetical protein